VDVEAGVCGFMFWTTRCIYMWGWWDVYFEGDIVGGLIFWCGGGYPFGGRGEFGSMRR